MKPTLSPNLNVLATVEALDVKKLLFIGVGCQVSNRKGFFYQDGMKFSTVGSRYKVDFDKQESALSWTILLKLRRFRLSSVYWRLYEPP